MTNEPSDPQETASRDVLMAISIAMNGCLFVGAVGLFGSFLSIALYKDATGAGIFLAASAIAFGMVLNASLRN